MAWLGNFLTPGLTSHTHLLRSKSSKPILSPGFRESHGPLIILTESLLPQVQRGQTGSHQSNHKQHKTILWTTGSSPRNRTNLVPAQTRVMYCLEEAWDPLGKRDGAWNPSSVRGGWLKAGTSPPSDPRWPHSPTRPGRQMKGRQEGQHVHAYRRRDVTDLSERDGVSQKKLCV